MIHRLPWLCSAVKEIDPHFAPTGEIDFLIIHKELGVLALEVKSGRYRMAGVHLVHLSTGKKTPRFDRRAIMSMGWQSG
ncbi:TPA: NERD domain-containing protein [Salmonella enterica]|uniref:NERD domain-containing protein n=1 Tax=Salmonella enterica TaxID=28901 RepID=A0A743YHM6_SALER|nr:NERD domain-containing protein [Salmonella enterica]